MDYNEIEAAFERFGIATEEQRRRLAGFAPQDFGEAKEQDLVFIVADTNTHVKEVKNARLEANPGRD